jgi:hypothetical protein
MYSTISSETPISSWIDIFVNPDQQYIK